MKRSHTVILTLLLVGGVPLGLTGCSPKDNAALENEVQEGVNTMQDGAEKLGNTVEQGTKQLQDTADAIGDGIQKGMSDDR